MPGATFWDDFFFDRVCVALLFLPGFLAESFGLECFFSCLRPDFFSAVFAGAFWFPALGLNRVCLP